MKTVTLDNCEKNKKKEGFWLDLANNDIVDVKSIQ